MVSSSKDRAYRSDSVSTPDTAEETLNGIQGGNSPNLTEDVELETDGVNYGEKMGELDSAVFDVLESDKTPYEEAGTTMYNMGEPQDNLITDGGCPSPESKLYEARDHMTLVQEEGEAQPLEVGSKTSMYEQEEPGTEVEMEEHLSQYESFEERGGRR